MTRPPRRKVVRETRALGYDPETGEVFESIPPEPEPVKPRPVKEREAPIPLEVEIVDEPDSALQLEVRDPESMAIAQRERARGEAYTAAAGNPRTKAVYDWHWEQFEAWATYIDWAAKRDDRRKLRRPAYETLPADGKTLRDYLAARAENGWGLSMLQVALAAIRKRHKKAHYQDPAADDAFQDGWKAIATEVTAAQTQKAALRWVDLRKVIAALPDTAVGIRDHAILLLGWMGAFRRSEIAALKVNDIEFDEAGVKVHIRKSKTDQRGEGKVVALPAHEDPLVCPVMALEAWLEAGNCKSGALFRPATARGYIKTKPIRGKDIAEIVKKAVERAGFDPALFSGHSLRRGQATEMIRRGVPMVQVMKHGRWQSYAAFQRYIDAEGWTDNVITSAKLE